MSANENHAEANAIGWSQTISELVSALNVDYHRLQELRDEREGLEEAHDDAQAEYLEARDDEEIAEAQEERDDAAEKLKSWYDENQEEWDELEAAAKVDSEPFKDAEEVRERIQEAPLSVQVRSAWHSPGDDAEPGEFEILLSTGGPALRIRGELDEHSEPCRAWLEHQDWFKPWTEFHGSEAPSQSELLQFCQQFYFGE